MPINPSIPMSFDTSQIYNPVKAEAQQQELALGRGKLAMIPQQQRIMQQQSQMGDLEILQKKNDMALGLLNGVIDQKSYEGAKARAAQFGLPVDNLPDQYDPKLIEQLQMGALSTKDRLDETFRQAQLTETIRHNKAAETLPTRMGAPGMGGATGALIQRYMDATGADFPTALYAIQTGLRQGLQYDQGAISPMAGLPEAKGAIKTAEKAGEITGEIEGGLKKKAAAARNTLDLTKQAKELLPSATSGRLEQLGIGTAKSIGISTKASQTDAKLKVISAGLTSNVPRMEGPQSNYDVQLYKEAAADVANSALPYEDRVAAIETIELIQQKYANLNKDSSAKPISQTDYKSIYGLE